MLIYKIRYLNVTGNRSGWEFANLSKKKPANKSRFIYLSYYHQAWLIGLGS
jgi:hypothetical protein